MASASDNIKVVVRARPLIKSEKDEKLIAQWTIQNNNIFQVDETGQRISEPYSFDHIFQMQKSNAEIYKEAVQSFIDAALNGLNSTIFAYGQTSSGKTYTMLGDKKDPGIMTLSIEHIFGAIDKCKTRKFLLRVSYIEIYNEKISDLLEPTLKDLKIRESIPGNVLIQNSKEEIVSTKQQVYDYLRLGNANRHIAETRMNERSSRSHTIFKILIESTEINDATNDSPIQVSSLNLVDLAGSERVAQTKATGVRLKEGSHINKSLSTLSLVIRQLSDNQEFVNFRDSKLTRLLQHSLGGNAKTLIIATITLAAVEHTHSTLSFAQRAKAVKNKPHINEMLSESAMARRYVHLNVQYKKKLEEQLQLNQSLERDKEEKGKLISRLQEQIQMLEAFQSNKIFRVALPTLSSKRRHTIAISSGMPKLHPISEELKPISEEVTEEAHGFSKRVPKPTDDEEDVDLDDSGSTSTTSVPENVSDNETDTETVIEDDLDQEAACSSTHSTPKAVLRSRLTLLQKSYEDLTDFTREEQNIMKENDEKIKDLRNQLISTKKSNEELREICEKQEKIIGKLKDNKDDEINRLNEKVGELTLENSVMKDQQRQEVDYLTEEMTTRFKIREHELLSRINELEEARTLPTEPSGSDTELPEIKEKLVLLEAILKRDGEEFHKIKIANSQISAEFADFVQDTQAKTEKIRNLTSENDELKLKLVTLQFQLDELTGTNDNLSLIQTSLGEDTTRNEDVQNLTPDNQTITKSETDIEKEKHSEESPEKIDVSLVEELKNTLESYKTKYAKLQHDNYSLDSIIEALTSECNELRFRCEEQSAIIATLNDEQDRLEAKFAKYGDNVLKVQTSDSEIKDLQETCAQFEAIIGELKQELKASNELTNEQDLTIDDYKSKLEIHEEKIGLLMQEVDSLQKLSSERAEIITNLQLTIDGIQSRNDEEALKVVRYEAEISKLLINIRDLKRTIKVTTSSVCEEHAKVIKELQAEIAGKQAQIEELTNKVENSETIIGELNKALQSYQFRLVQTEQELARCEKYEKEIIDVQKSLDQAVDENKTANEKIAKLITERDGLIDNNKSLEKELDDAKSQNKLLSEKIDYLTESNESLSVQNQSMEKELQSAELQRKSYEETVDSLASCNDDLCKREESLEKELESLRLEHTTCEEKMAVLLQGYSTLLTRTQSLERELEDTKTQEKVYEVLVEDYKDSFEKKSKENIVLKSENEDIVSHCETLKNQMIRLEADYEELLLTNDYLVKNHKEVNDNMAADLHGLQQACDRYCERIRVLQGGEFDPGDDAIALPENPIPGDAPFEISHEVAVLTETHKDAIVQIMNAFLREKKTIARTSRAQEQRDFMRDVRKNLKDIFNEMKDFKESLTQTCDYCLTTIVDLFSRAFYALAQYVDAEKTYFDRKIERLDNDNTSLGDEMMMIEQGGSDIYEPYKFHDPSTEVQDEPEECSTCIQLRCQIKMLKTASQARQEGCKCCKAMLEDIDDLKKKVKEKNQIIITAGQKINMLRAAKGYDPEVLPTSGASTPPVSNYGASASLPSTPADPDENWNSVCDECPRLKDKIQTLQDELRLETRKTVELQLQLFEEQDVKAQAETMEVVEFYKEQNKILKVKLEKLQNNATTETASVEVQCSILDSEKVEILTTKCELLKKVCKMRDEKIAELNAKHKTE